MKKTVSLFLSLLLTFTMTVGVIIPGAAFAAPADKTLKASNTVYDTTGASGINLAETGTSNAFMLQYVPAGSTTAENHAAIYYRHMVAYGEGDVLKLQRKTSGSGYMTYYLHDSKSTAHNNSKYVISGEYMCTKADASGYIDFTTCTLQVNRTSGHGNPEFSFDGYLKANVWYEFEYLVDATQTPHLVKVTYTNKSTGEVDYTDQGTFTGDDFNLRADMHIDGRYESFDASQDYFAFKNIKLSSLATAQKSDITAVNSGINVDPNQNELDFTLSEKIEGLTKDDVVAVDEFGEVNSAADIAVSQNGKEITATMVNNFSAWTDYTLKINPSVYEGYVYSDGGAAVTQSELEMPFSVNPTGYDMREVSISSAGGTAAFNMEYVNIDSAAMPLTLLLPQYSSDGVMQNITAETIAEGDLSVNGITKNVSISAPLSGASTAKMIAIDSWTGKLVQFGRCWSINDNADTLEAYSSAQAITLGGFDYDNNKINVGINTNAGAPVSGVIYVYDTALGLSASALPVYTNYLTSANDGTFTFDIPFKDNINAVTTSYTVEFVSPACGSLSDTFTCLDENDIRVQKETVMYNDAKAAVTVGGLRQIILGVDEIDNVVNDNFAVISYNNSANIALYNSLANKDNVFALMIGSVSGINSYAELKALFNTNILHQYNSEHTFVSSPSSDNSSYGGTGSVIKDTSPVVPSNPSDSNANSNTSSGGAVFTDMSGHWASKFASELSGRGIMNGYPDGSFNGEGLITRAELAKTLVEAIDIALGTGSAYGDVDVNAWHSPYIAGAANAGIVTGFEDGSFGPELSVTRQDAAVMLFRALCTKMIPPMGYVFFADDLDISPYAADAVSSLGELKIINGTPDGRFNPHMPITRGEIAALICRALDYIESH